MRKTVNPKNSEIAEYYKHCDWDYKVIWRDRKSLGMHIGFWTTTTKSHPQSLINQNVEMEMQAKNMMSAYYAYKTFNMRLWGYGLVYAEK